MAQLVENVTHLREGERIVCFHRGMTRHAVRDATQGLVHAASAIESFQSRSQRLDGGQCLFDAKKRGNRRDSQRLSPELVEFEPEALQRRAMGYERLSAC